MSEAKKNYQIRINGQKQTTDAIAEDLPMVDYLHEHLNMTGTHLGCGIGICHACVVILDHPDGRSEEIRTCITPAAFFDQKSIRTIEAHSQKDSSGKVIRLSPIQEKFLHHFAFQCGYCTPGFVNAATVLMEKLQKQPIAKDQVEQQVSAALESHICRCTGYVKYYQAVKDAVLSTPGLTTGT